MSSTNAPQAVLGAPEPTVDASSSIDVAQAAALSITEVLRRLGVASAESGLPGAEVARRRERFGPNAVASHRARLFAVLWHQLRSPLLGLLMAAAIASAFVGERSDAVIIFVIVGLSVGLGLANEYRAEKAAEALHSQLRQRAVVIRDGRQEEVDVTDLVPGDVLHLKLGDIVPADVRLLEVTALQCDESVLTGESLPVDKQIATVPAGTVLAELTDCALMGTVVHAGSGRAVVVSTGARTEFGAIAAGLATRQLDTEFQVGLRQFSMLLVYVAGALTTAIFAINVALHKPVLDALLFSLAIAVGITPQLLPAVVSTSLAAGSRQLSRRKVLVKRLVCIEDLGDVDTLFTDKTGTLTEGRIDYMRAVPESGRHADEVLRLGLLCTENAAAEQPGVGGNALDQALWDSPAAVDQRSALQGYTRLALRPFDHDRMLVSMLMRGPDGALIQVTKGAPEAVLARCTSSSQQSRAALQREFDDGNRVIAVAVRSVAGGSQATDLDEHGLSLAGLLVFLDRPKPDAAVSLRRLADLGVAVKVVTGDNPAVATTVCAELGLPRGGTLTGAQIQQLDDDALRDAVATTTVFARTSPEDKARIVRTQRRDGKGVAFLGDGVNDALALHAADVGISVDSATDVARDAADVILLEKSLGVLADGVAEGRRIFANTLKYVLMGTSSNFGNMFSAAGASLFLSFLPMLPSQILLNNLLYDTSQLAIPTDNVDAEQLRRPSHWDVRFIRRFMLVFGPISSIFDFITFAVMLGVFHAGAAEFRSGWFIESLATQTLVIFAIRTRRFPFFRSHPSLPLTLAALAVVAVGMVLPASAAASALGFRPLPGDFFAVLVAMIVAYLALIEIVKRAFYRLTPAPRPQRPFRRQRRVRRRAGRFSTSQPMDRPRRAAGAMRS